jgi:hypothetical protein
MFVGTAAKEDRSLMNICFVKRFGSKWNRDKNEYTIV